MKTISITLSVDDIRRATFGKKVRIIRAGTPLTEEYLQVSLVTTPPPNRHSQSTLVCTMYFVNDQYTYVRKGDKIEILDEATTAVPMREDNKGGDHYES